MALDESTRLSLFKKYGEKTFSLAPDRFRLTTGLQELDDWMGGGLPRGKIIELYGMESSGKSTLAIEIGKRLQFTHGEHIVWIDSEWAFEEDYAHSIGMSTDPDYFILARPRTIEESFQIAREIMAKTPGGLYVIDSLAAVPPRSDVKALESDKGELSDKIGSHSLAISRALQVIGQDIGQSGAILLIINQVRTKMTKGGPGGMTISQTTPGGHAPKFYAAMRWKISRARKIKKTLPSQGREVDVWECTLTMTKTKVSDTEGQELKIWVVPTIGCRVAKSRTQLKEDE